MLQNYFKTILRGFRKDTIYSFISVIGLVIAFAAVLLIAVFIQFERSFDKHFSQSEQVFLLYLDKKDGNASSTREYLVDLNLSPTLQTDVTGIAAVSMFNPFSENFVAADGEPITQRTLSVDAGFFQIFDLPFVSGDPRTALQAKESMVLTAKAAMDFFNTVDVVGKMLSVEDALGSTTTYTVTGVVEAIPSNTSFDTDIFVNQGYKKGAFTWETKFKLMGKQFIRLDTDVSLADVNRRLEAFAQQYQFPDDVQIGLMPLHELHFSDEAALQAAFETRDVRYLYMFGGVAILILIIACINYINLSMARSLQRIKEVGVRKTVGASKAQLIFQFVGESFFYFIVALPLAFVLTYWSAPLFFDIFEISVPESFLFNIKVIGFVTVVTLVAGLGAGAYPAFFLSHQHPSQIFGSQHQPFNINFGLRRVLVVVQFGIAIFLIAFTIGMYQQTKLLQHRQLGFNSDYLVALPQAQFREHYAAFKHALTSHKDIHGFTTSSIDIGNQHQHRSQDTLAGIDIQRIVGDFDLVETMGMRIKAGRNFLASSDFERNFDAMFILNERYSNGADEQTIADLERRRPILVSENLVQTYGLENPIGRVFEDRNNTVYGTIVGVIDNFDFGPQRGQSAAKVIYGDYPSFYGGYGYVRIAASNIPTTLQYIADVWKQFAPYRAFSYQFVDQRVQRLYEAEVRLVTLFGAFASLAIGISALGLFSLVALMVRHRTKEIGIRKVLGATVSDIAVLFSKDFVWQVSLALLLAIPLSWWALNSWLENYAYRIAIGWSIFALAGLSALVIALLTVNLQAFRAAMANPVDSLRDE